MLPVETCQSILNEEVPEGGASFSREEARRLRDAFYEAARAQMGADDLAAGSPDEAPQTDDE